MMKNKAFFEKEGSTPQAVGPNPTGTPSEPTGGAAKINKQGVPLSGIPVGLEGEVGGSLKAPGTTGGAAAPQRTVGTPLSGIPVGLEGEPGGFAAGKGTTDASGSVTFKDLKPGNYRVQLPKPARSSGYDPVIGGVIQVTTFVNGKVQSRQEFPVGSSVGTFAVASAKDITTLKFESKGSTPVNGIGGMGGGR